MRYLLGFLALGALLLVGASFLVSVAERYDPVLSARERAELARIARDAALEEQWAPVRAAALNVTLLIVLALLIAGLLIATVILVQRLADERRPDRRGLLPVAVGQLHQVAPAALASYHAAQLAAAQRPNVPHSYAPHSSQSYAPHITAPPTPPTPPAPAAPAALLPGDMAMSPATVPSFAELLERGEVGPGRPMLLGYADGAPVVGSWLDLYSCAVGGLSGSGKSWTACFLAAQAALYGARIVLLDPHADNAESLAQRLAPMRGRFVCEVATTPVEMRRAVDLVADELERRKAGARGDGWIVIADEFSALQRGGLAEPLGRLVEGLGQEGRKLHLYGLICGQVWSATRSGGSELRDSLASAYVHRLRPAQARMLTGLTADELPADLLSLPAGAAYLLSTAGDLRRLTIPQMRPADLVRVAELAGPERGQGGAAAGPRQPPAGGPRPGCGPAAAALSESGASAAGRSETISADAARLLARFRAGTSVHGLAAELGGTENPSARSYKVARANVEGLLRAALPQG